MNKVVWSQHITTAMKSDKLYFFMPGLLIVSALVLAAAAMFAIKGFGFGRLRQQVGLRQQRLLLPVLAPPCGKGSPCPLDVHQEATHLSSRAPYVVPLQNWSAPASGRFDANSTGFSGHPVADMAGPPKHEAASPSTSLPIIPASVQPAGVQLVTSDSVLPHPLLPRIRTR